MYGFIFSVGFKVLGFSGFSFGGFKVTGVGIERQGFSLSEFVFTTALGFTVQGLWVNDLPSDSNYVVLFGLTIFLTRMLCGNWFMRGLHWRLQVTHGSHELSPGRAAIANMKPNLY